MNIVDGPIDVQEVILVSAPTLIELEDLCQDCADDGWEESGLPFNCIGMTAFYQLLTLPPRGEL